jgi:hypothetical protein
MKHLIIEALDNAFQKVQSITPQTKDKTITLSL